MRAASMMSRGRLRLMYYFMKKNTVGAKKRARQISGQRVLVSFIESIGFKKAQRRNLSRHRRDEQNNGELV